MTPERTLIYAYHVLPDVYRREIARKLRLLTCNQLSQLDGTEMDIAIVKAVVAKRKKKAFAKLVKDFTDEAKS